MILENQELRIYNLISLRKKISQQDLASEMKKLEDYIIEKGIKKNGPAITTTFGVEQTAFGQVLDMEILIPLDREIMSEDEYRFKKEFYLTNALRIVHLGNPVNLQNTYNVLNKYIFEKGVLPITPAYNVAIQEAKSLSDIDSVEIHIYVGVNPNKL